MSFEKTDYKKLEEFLQELEYKMDLFVYEWGPSFLKIKNNDDTKKARLMREAWKETSPRFKELQKYLSSEESIEKLEKVGLTASSLAFKLSLVEESIEEINKVMESKTMVETSDIPKKRLGFLKKLKKPWQKYFEHADTIIRSMGVAGIPGADAIGEFKTSLEKILNWWGKK